MDRVVFTSNGEETEVQAKVVSRPSELKVLLNDDCTRIFARLREKPSFPAEIAKELKLNEQKVYYCIKRLAGAGLIGIEKTEERNGALAKYYTALFDSFAIIPNPEAVKKRPRLLRKASSEGPAGAFLRDFTKNGVLSAKIVVGSPDPHGPFKARARDGHLAAELAAFLGANCAGFELPLVFLDTMVNDLRHENSNLIILGGPVTNKLAEQANEFLPIKFVPSANWEIRSEASGKTYLEDSIGIVEKVPHPHFKGKWLLLLAGKRNTGTIAAILALAKKTREAIKPNIHNSGVFARVVEGLDLDGDGLIDEVEFKE